jgi:AraC-like DNA-binding protein
MQKTFIPRTRGTKNAVIAGANWFQFAPAERILHPRVLSRMLLWCHEGLGRIRVNGTWHPLDTDRYLFLPWGHEIVYLASPERPFRVGGIHLIPDHPRDRKLVFAISHRENDAWARCRWRRDAAWPGLEGVRAGLARPAEPLRHLATYIVERFAGGGLDDAALRLLARLLVGEIAAAVKTGGTPHRGGESVRRVREFIENHLDRPLSIAELARAADCSASTVRRQFHDALGIPPYEWILRLRIDRAQRLLATTNLRVKEIAAQVGFDDPFQFSRIFRQRAGQSPREFRHAQAFHPRPR